MPTYQYRCAECGNDYEAREGFDAPAVQACPRCGGRAKRVYSAPPIVFKGAGWYVTDSRKGTSATVTSPSSSDDSPSSTTSEPAAAPAAPAAEPAKSSSTDD